MSIEAQLQPVINSLLDGLKADIQAELRDKVNTAVIEKLASTEINNIVLAVTKQQLEERLSNYNLEATSKRQLEIITGQIVNQLRSDVVPQLNDTINKELKTIIERIDIRTLASAVIEGKVRDLVTNGAFPHKSIPHSSVNLEGLVLTGDSIRGGIIEEFGSTGIEDRASHVQMTLMDHATVFEGPLWAPEVKVKGSATVEGTLTVDGDLLLKGDIASDSPALGRIVNLTTERVRNTLDHNLFSQYSSIVTQQILENGLDLDKIKQGGREVLSGNQLGYHIVDSNLQRVGMLRDLQTQGESLLSETLYTSSHRVGINTLEPETVLSVWDQEVEFIVTKRESETGYIGTSRAQSLVLGSSRKNNITLRPTGAVEVNDLKIGNVNFTSASGCPSTSGTPGQIVWNEGPTSGGYIGWVCLGGTRWAGFGQIE